MNFPDNFAALARYNQWINRLIYDCAARLTDEERKRDVGAFFQSLHGTMNHLLLGDKVWLGRFVGEPFAAASLGQELYSDFAALRAEREAHDLRILAWANRLEPAWLASRFEYRRVNGVVVAAEALLMVTHFFNHQAHHRGQMTTILMQLGVNPGDVDLIMMPGVVQTL